MKSTADSSNAEGGTGFSKEDNERNRDFIASRPFGQDLTDAGVFD
jgi:hypothetical protein